MWRGRFDSGIIGSINKTYLLTKCGINRVFVRSTLTAGPDWLPSRWPAE
jgi:beta-galactosidase